MQYLTLLLPLLPLTLAAPAPLLTARHRAATSTVDDNSEIAGQGTGVGITMYTSANCKGSTVQTVELQYNNPIAQQFHSYTLNGSFSEDQKVGIYAEASWKATGFNGVDNAAIGNVAVGCEQFVYNLAPDMMTEGCHGFDAMMGCIEVQMT